MHRQPDVFAALLDAAADDIGSQSIHPGQTIPGVWKLAGEDAVERLIVVIATAALSRVCRAQNVDVARALASYAGVARHVEIVPKGAPDEIATQHLRDAAAELRRSVTRVLKMAV